MAKFDITLDDPEVFMELGNSEAIVQIVAASYGISFVSTLATSCLHEKSAIVNLPVEGMTLKRMIHMVRRRISTPQRPRDVFWSFIHDPSNMDLIDRVEHYL